MGRPRADEFGFRSVACTGRKRLSYIKPKGTELSSLAAFRVADHIVVAAYYSSARVDGRWRQLIE